MRNLIILPVSLIAFSFAVRTSPKRLERKQLNDPDDISNAYFSPDVSKVVPTNRSSKSELIVEKFVDTLMSSERYLKMVETVERKLNHLDATFHERTNSILKHLVEMLRTVKASPANSLENSLLSVKNDLDKLKMRLLVPEQPIERGDGHSVHSSAALDSRLSNLEGSMKNVLAGVDSIVSTISEVKTRQFSRPNVKSEGGQGSLDLTGLLNEFRKTMHEQKTRKCECRAGRVDRSERYPTDCHEIQMQGFNVSGIYKIKPEDIDPFYVLCDLTTAGGGWTVFQNRYDGSQEFFKNWSDYKHGFGNLAGEFWLGLEKLSFLTNQKLYELRVELESSKGHEGYAVYSVFTVAPEYEGFRISTLGTYYGNAGDSLSYHAGQKFSTLDVDNDEWKDGACSQEHGGAWWYKECDKSNLNGKYTLTADEQGQSIYWISFKSPEIPLTKTKMMIRPLPASKPISYEATRKYLESANHRPHGTLTVSQAKEGKSGHHHPYRYEEPGNIHDAFFANFS